MTRLDEIRERWEKATPGPWALDPAFWSPPSWGETMHYRRVVHGEPNKNSGIRRPIFSTNGATDGSEQARQNHHDASAVAAAPGDVAWLLDLVGRQHDQFLELNKVIADQQERIDDLNDEIANCEVLKYKAQVERVEAEIATWNASNSSAYAARIRASLAPAEVTP